jgi:hypothetical protein
MGQTVHHGVSLPSSSGRHDCEESESDKQAVDCRTGKGEAN